MIFKKIKLDEIDCNDKANIRKDYGKLDELVASLKQAGENVAPIGVLLEKNKYQLIYGFRRCKALKEANILDANCNVYENIDDVKKFQLMYAENLGRKDLNWSEEAFALTQKIELEKGAKGIEEIIKDVAIKEGKSTRSIRRILEAANIVKEIEILKGERTRSAALSKYKLLKKLTSDTLEKVKNGELSIKKAIKSIKIDTIKKKIDSNTFVIDELKGEIENYKERLDNIHEEVIKIPKAKRIEKGLWVEKEVDLLIEAAKTCEAFGVKDIEPKICKECEKNSPKIKERCDFWHERKTK